MFGRYLEYLLVLLGLKKSEKIGFYLTTRLARRMVPSYKFTWPELRWFVDKDLNGLLHKFGEDDGFNAHRRFALQQLLRLTALVPGDTAECGVYKGLGSLIILRAIQGSTSRKTHHIFDSFEGLSCPTEKDGMYWAAGSLSIAEDVVRNNLKEFPNFKMYKGWIPKRFPEVKDYRFSFVHADVDLHDPTRDSITFFYDRLNAGGIFVCDDYAFLTCPGATAAVDDFLRDKPEKMISLPGGGGFFIKGCVTAGE